MAELDLDTYQRMQRVTPELADPLRVAVELRIRLHVGGALSVEGPMGDKAFCKRMLEEAWDAIRRQHGAERLLTPSPVEETRLVIPEQDVEMAPKDGYLCLSL